jgi:prevent-host-death family protein
MEEMGMSETYSAYEAKAKFSEILRKVRAGQRVVIAYRGEEIAEIRPLGRDGHSLAKSLKRLEDQGRLSRARTPTGPLSPLVKKPGALARFLDARALTFMTLDIPQKEMVDRLGFAT